MLAYYNEPAAGAADNDNATDLALARKENARQAEELEALRAKVAELEAQASAGQPISLMDLADAVHREQMDKRPSVMQQLKTANRQEPKKTASKDAEMER